jgi:Nif-specific regulatory protein
MVPSLQIGFFLQDLSLDEALRFLTIGAALLAQIAEIRREFREREHALEEEKRCLHSEILDHFKLENIVGNSHAIRRIYLLIHQVSSSEVRALITIESGAGKGWLRQSI